MNPLRGTRGHPLHPPITDAAIGMFTLAAALAIIGAIGWIEDAAGKGMWLALLGGLIAAAGAAVTGLLDWLHIERGTPLWRTATTHMAVMVTTVLLFAIAAILQYDGFHDGDVTTGGLVFALLGFATLVVGGWLGGSLVFVHGNRVVGDEQAGVRESADPLAHERRPSGRRTRETPT